jgi:hypothetical protein
LLVSNSGGDAVFSATGQVVAITGAKKNSITHTAPFQMVWRNAETHEPSKGHRCTIEAGRRHKLVVASYHTGGDFAKGKTLRIHGDQWVVDSYWTEHWAASSPLVTMDVEIVAEPPLLPPFRERFLLVIPPNERVVRIARAKT